MAGLFGTDIYMDKWREDEQNKLDKKLGLDPLKKILSPEELEPLRQERKSQQVQIDKSQAIKDELIELEKRIASNPKLSPQDAQLARKTKYGSIAQKYNIPMNQLANIIGANNQQPQPSPQQQMQQQAQPPMSIGGSSTITQRSGDSAGLRSLIRGWKKEKEEFGDTKQAFNDAQLKQAEAVQSQAELQIAQNKELENQATQKRMLIDDEIRDHKTKQLERQTIVDNEMKNLAAAQSQVDNFKGEDFSTGQKIALVIGTALMSYGSTLAGGDGSSGMKSLNEIIERQIRSNKEKYNKLKGKIQDQKNYMSDLRKRWNDEDIADAGERALLWRKAEVKAQEMLSKTKNPEVQAKLQQQLAQIQSESARVNMAFQEKLDAKILDAQKAADQLSLQRETIRASQKQDRRKRVSEGMNEKLANLEHAPEKIERFRKEFQDKTGIFSLISQMVPGTDANTYNRKREALVGTLVKAIYGARASDQDTARISSLIPSAATPDWQAESLFDEIRALAISSHKELLNNLGISRYDVERHNRPIGFKSGL